MHGILLLAFDVYSRAIRLYLSLCTTEEVISLHVVRNSKPLGNECYRVYSIRPYVVKLSKPLGKAPWHSSDRIYMANWGVSMLLDRDMFRGSFNSSKAECVLVRIG